MFYSSGYDILYHNYLFQREADAGQKTVFNPANHFWLV